MKRFYFFLIGMLFTMFSSCQEPLSGYKKHVYRNNSEHVVELSAYINGSGDKEFTLEPSEEQAYEHYSSEGKNNPPFDLSRYAWDDSVVTIFDDTLSIMYDRGRLDGNPMRIENYELVEGEKEPYIYLFEFTNEDYQRALDRGRITQ